MLNVLRIIVPVVLTAFFICACKKIVKDSGPNTAVPALHETAENEQQQTAPVESPQDGYVKPDVLPESNMPNSATTAASGTGDMESGRTSAEARAAHEREIIKDKGIANSVEQASAQKAIADEKASYQAAKQQEINNLDRAKAEAVAAVQSQRMDAQIAIDKERAANSAETESAQSANDAEKEKYRKAMQKEAAVKPQSSSDDEFDELERRKSGR
jgi:hypothetical protein